MFVSTSPSNRQLAALGTRFSLSLSRGRSSPGRSPETNWYHPVTSTKQPLLLHRRSLKSDPTRQQGPRRLNPPTVPPLSVLRAGRRTRPSTQTDAVRDRTRPSQFAVRVVRRAVEGAPGVVLRRSRRGVSGTEIAGEFLDPRGALPGRTVRIGCARGWWGEFAFPTVRGKLLAVASSLTGIFGSWGSQLRRHFPAAASIRPHHRRGLPPCLASRSRRAKSDSAGRVSDYLRGSPRAFSRLMRSGRRQSGARSRPKRTVKGY